MKTLNLLTSSLMVNKMSANFLLRYMFCITLSCFDSIRFILAPLFFVYIIFNIYNDPFIIEEMTKNHEKLTNINV